jgi:hypothetical protein
MDGTKQNDNRNEEFLLLIEPERAHNDDNNVRKNEEHSKTG